MLTWANKAVGYLIRPCYAHRWLLLACLIATNAYAAVSVQGDSSPSSYGYGVVFFEHGWPMEYMRRTLPETTWGSRWCIVSGIYKFEYAPLLINIAVAIALSFLIAHLWQLHCARCKPWQFTLRELLLVTFVLCVALGAYAKLRHDYICEETYLSELGEIGWSPRFASGHLPWHLQPLKDLGIIREDDWLYREVAWEADLNSNAAARDINRMLADQVSQGRRLSFVRSAIVADPRLTDQGIELLCKWAPYCTSLDILDCPKVTDRGVAYLASHLTNLNSLGVEGATITDDAIQHIATLRGLEQLSIGDRSNSTTGKSMKHLRNLPRLTDLGVPKHWSTDIDEEDRRYLIRRKITVWHPSDGR